MHNVTCPNCQKQNAYVEFVHEKGISYNCPDCEFEWSDTSADGVPKEFDEFGIEYNEIFGEIKDMFKDAELYVYQTINKVLINIITEFSKYQLNAEHLSTLSKLYVFTSKVGMYKIKGFIRFSANTNKDDSIMIFNEIFYDAKGLRITEKGYHKFHFDYEDFNEIIYPPNSEATAKKIHERLEEFLHFFLEKLIDGEIIIEENISEIKTF